jgi:hypothetical protein
MRALVGLDGRATQACARPDAADFAEGRLGGLARRAAGCGGVAVPAL